MMRIAVCDDQKMVCEKLREMILCGEESQYEVDLFQGGEEFLNAKGRYDILFLDIDMPGLDRYQTSILIPVERRE